MDILNNEYTYSSKEEFEQLKASIQKEIDNNNLLPYIDQAWTGRHRKKEWSGEYISTNSRKVFWLDGMQFSNALGALNYKGNWSIIRCEENMNGIIAYKSQYQVRRHEPGVFAHIDFEVVYQQQPKTSILIDWESGNPVNKASHSSLIKSSVEFGIVSAFEDITPETGQYHIKIKDLRYHQIDTSFTLLFFVSNRNLKRSLFKETEDLNPRWEDGNIVRRFRVINTIGRFNN